MMVYKVSPSPQPCNRHTASPGKVAPTVFIRLNRLITISKLFFRFHCSYSDAAPTVPLFTLPILYQRNIHNLEEIGMKNRSAKYSSKDFQKTSSEAFSLGQLDLLIMIYVLCWPDLSYMLQCEPLGTAHNNRDPG